MADIKIRHTMEDGTILTGSRKGDGVWELAKANGFTYRRSVGIIILGSRDRSPRKWNINRAKAELEAAGHTVSLQLETALRDPDVREEALRERLEVRQDRLAGRGDRLAATGQATYNQARRMGEVFPLGQPSMPDH
jgi:hypothetical protein